MEIIKKFNRVSALSTILVRRPLTRCTSNFPIIEKAAEEDVEVKGNDINNNDKPVPDMSNPFQKEKQKCILCQLNIHPDWKNVRLLSQFQSSYTGRIYGRHITGLCRQKQEEVTKEILKAQAAGFMPYYLKEPIFMKDPKLYNPEKPARLHPY